jgi:membrane protease subunit (stomatin/prohibitin family)
MPRIFDVLSYDEYDPNYMAVRVPETGAADIRMGSQLIVREGQVAIFYRDGKSLDTFGPGRNTLTTGNIPLLTGLLSGLLTSGNTPFQTEVYFVSTKPHRNMKWGTSEPVVFRDKELDMVRLRAFGNYSLVVDDPSLFVGKVAAARGAVNTEDMEGILRASIINHFMDTMGEVLTTILDLPQHYEELGVSLKGRIAQDFAVYGLKVTDFFIQAITPPPEVEKLMDERAGMGAVGDMNRYMQFKAAKAMEEAAGTEGSGMGAGLGMGMGMAGTIASTMASAAQQGQKPATGGVTCPKCGTVNQPGAKFCNNCGISLEPAGPITCPKCNTVNPAGSSFCTNCGTKLG